MRSLSPDARLLIFLLCSWTTIQAQSSASIEGVITDQHGALITGAVIKISDRTIGITRTTQTDNSGSYQIVALPPGNYQIKVRAKGFQTHIVDWLALEVGRRVTQDFRLEVGDLSQQVTVGAEPDFIERATTSVGHVVDQVTVQEAPLNGRYFLDLGLLVPGSVT